MPLDSFPVPPIGQRLTVTGAPEGADARFIADMLRHGGALRQIMFVARDDARMARMEAGLRFFAPNLDIVTIPAWDCLPYDRVSPHADIIARRIDGLLTLRNDPVAPRVVLTTVAAYVQRVPPRTAFDGQVLSLHSNQPYPLESVTAYLRAHGYSRAETVSEAGEYAQRGDILDIFPTGFAQPVRIDFFGDVIERLRLFDPLTQRSEAGLDHLTLKPVSEIPADPQAVERFRGQYRALFGAAATDDPLYQAVSDGRRYQGVEHWLPLFHAQMETLFDYAGDCPVVLDEQGPQAIAARLEMIADFYRARLDLQKADQASGAGVYRPLPSDALYLASAALADLESARSIMVLSGFAGAGNAQGAPTADAGGRAVRDFAAERAKDNSKLYQALIARIEEEQKSRPVVIAAHSIGSLERFKQVLHEHRFDRLAVVDDWPAMQTLDRGILGLTILPLDQGFSFDDCLVFTEADILGERMARAARRRKRSAEQYLAELANFVVGDYVVHRDHGVGKFEGLIAVEAAGAPHDCVKLLYDGGDRLYVPVENLDVISRFGSADLPVALDKLGGVAWQSRKARVKQRIREVAQYLLQVAAERTLRAGAVIEPPEGLYDEFCARFPYAETDDQLRAIDDVIGDFAAGRPMDRLICGDVGFGKTEVAMRAAFIAAMAGFQVAIVAPTTLLCRQHFKNFSERFRGLPLRVAQLSRLVPAKEAAQAKKDIAEGTVDIVIGTHALLAKSLSFKNLGLLVVDEEQHFGVAQKERLKQLKTDIHVLTLTATPIPRTLQMALSGVRDMSVITTPPVDRLAVRTFVMPSDPVILREAILREHYRGGQIFYVCPRIEDLDALAEQLRRLVPEVKLLVAHGQMAATYLENAMTAFYDRQYDVLLSTHIVESGLDIPTANTIIIHRSDLFGLAQLYQLRGRVGRSKLRGYAYLTIRPDRTLSEAAEKRLKVMETLDTLGAGFTLASHDLDIRGAGNLLGEEQSGHIREVGVELYQQMLEDAVQEARGSIAATEQWSPVINLGMAVLIPDSYVADLNLRLGLYRRAAALEDTGAIDGFAAELVDRFGPMPPEVDNLLSVIAIKHSCRVAGIEKLETGPKGAVISFRHNRFARPEALIGFIQKNASSLTLRPDHRLVYRQNWVEEGARVRGARRIAEALAKLAIKKSDNQA